MPPNAAIALKEWAAVCRALAAGRQTILLRKGGVAEGPGGFQPDHSEFWLLPTGFHERPLALKPLDRRFFDSPAAPPAGSVRIDLFARVAEVWHLDREELLERLADEHVYGQQTVRDRFHYRRPGLWLLAVQIFQSPLPAELQEWPELAGCHSWVPLPAALSTDRLKSVLEPAALAARLASLRQVLDLPAESSPPPAAAPSDAPPAASAVTSPVDTAAILDRFGGDDELVERLITIYRQDRPGWMSRALVALVQQDSQDLVFAAHRLHGLLAHFEPTPAAQTAGRLEQLARKSDFGAAQTALGQLVAELAAFDAAIDGWHRKR